MGGVVEVLRNTEDWVEGDLFPAGCGTARLDRAPWRRATPTEHGYAKVFIGSWVIPVKGSEPRGQELLGPSIGIRSITYGPTNERWRERSLPRLGHARRSMALSSSGRISKLRLRGENQA